MTPDGCFNYNGKDYPYVILEQDGKGYLIATNDLKDAILDGGVDTIDAQSIMQQVYEFVDRLDYEEEFLRTLIFPQWVKT